MDKKRKNTINGLKGTSFRMKNEWSLETYYYNDDFYIDCITFDGAFLYAKNNHLSSENKKPILIKKNGVTTGVVENPYWNFIFSGMAGPKGDSSIPIYNETTGFVEWKKGSDELTPISWNIKGEKGEKGEKGKDSKPINIDIKKGDDGLEYWVVDDNWVLSDNNSKLRATPIDGITPVINADRYNGYYSWKVNGEWVLDSNNNPVRAEGVNGINGLTPSLLLKNGYLYSTLDKINYKQIGRVQGEQGLPGLSPMLARVRKEGYWDYIAWGYNGDPINKWTKLLDTVDLKGDPGDQNIHQGCDTPVDLDQIWYDPCDENPYEWTPKELVYDAYKTSGGLSSEEDFTKGYLLIPEIDNFLDLDHVLMTKPQILSKIQKYVTKNNIDLENVDNTRDVDKISSNDTLSKLKLKINLSEKGASNGVASLDLNGKVPLSELSEAVLGGMDYQGVWDASTNTPDLTVVQIDGHFYICSVGGIIYGEEFTPGDWIISNGSEWQKIENTHSVTSVNGRLGLVVLNKSDVDLNNVDNTSDKNKPISDPTKYFIDQNYLSLNPKVYNELLKYSCRSNIDASSYVIKNDKSGIKGYGTGVVVGDFSLEQNKSLVGTNISYGKEGSTSSGLFLNENENSLNFTTGSNDWIKVARDKDLKNLEISLNNVVKYGDEKIIDLSATENTLKSLNLIEDRVNNNKVISSKYLNPLWSRANAGYLKPNDLHTESKSFLLELATDESFSLNIDNILTKKIVVDFDAGEAFLLIDNIKTNLFKTIPNRDGFYFIQIVYDNIESLQIIIDGIHGEKVNYVISSNISNSDEIKVAMARVWANVDLIEIENSYNNGMWDKYSWINHQDTISVKPIHDYSVGYITENMVWVDLLGTKDLYPVNISNDEYYPEIIYDKIDPMSSRPGNYIGQKFINKENLSSWEYYGPLIKSDSNIEFNWISISGGSQNSIPIYYLNENIPSVDSAIALNKILNNENIIVYLKNSNKEISMAYYIEPVGAESLIRVSYNMTINEYKLKYEITDNTLASVVFTRNLNLIIE